VGDRIGPDVRHASSEIARQLGEEVHVQLLLARGDVICLRDAIGGAHREADALAFFGGIHFERKRLGLVHRRRDKSGRCR
jgi:hypothetical protein